MRRKNLRKVIAGVMALTMVALAMGIVSVRGNEAGSVVSASVTAVAEQDELAELQEELVSDLELMGEGLGSSDEVKQVIAEGISAVNNAESFDELEDVWESVKAQINALF